MSHFNVLILGLSGYVGLFVPKTASLLEMIAHSAVQSSTQDTFHNTILFIETSTMLDRKKTHFLIHKPYLTIIASNRNKLIQSGTEYSFDPQKSAFGHGRCGRFGIIFSIYTPF